MKITIVGASGRMGLAVARLAKAEGATIVGAVVSPRSTAVGEDIGEAAGVETAGVVMSADLSAGLLGADVAIDFSNAAAVPELLRAAMRARVAVVSGTTRLEPAAERLLDEAAKVIPVLWSPNTSVGVHLLAELVTRAIQKLGPGYDVEVIEAHHRAKVDAPSGTAMRLVDAAKAARAELEPVFGREGNVGPRVEREVGVHAVRGGDVIGEHTVHLLGPGERIELTHRATSRDLFARGALRAARFLVGKPPGRYAMVDVLGG
ncbi:MAG TPA: 4-hydroxy-tetrahydrodipicolinate reductase [Byssovorax sp.]